MNENEHYSAQQGLRKIADQIFKTWEISVHQEIVSAAVILRPVLLNALPQFLDSLGEALSEEKSRGLMEKGSNIVKKHAEERARESSYSHREIIQELQMLKNVVIDSLEKELKLTRKNYETIQRSFDQAIQEALIEYFLVHAELREQLTATLGHDLRTPLSVAKISAQIMNNHLSKIDDVNIKKEFSFLSNKINSSLKRIDKMIQDLLDASVLSFGRELPMRISKCDLYQIVTEVINDLDDGDQKRITFIGSSTRGYWDNDALRRAIENLIKNAIKYGEKAGIITIEITLNDQEVYLSVHNTGNPIPPEERESIFQPFNRSKSVVKSSHSGWGIGLALVRAVSRSLGGDVSLESDAINGTTFTIQIPSDSRPRQMRLPENVYRS